MRFSEFYDKVFLAEHTHPVNVSLHVIGTLASIALLFGIFMGILPLWLLILYPVVHAAPGLLGHKLFEPNAAVGNLRVFRTDYPGRWFLVGNHIMTFRILTFLHHNPHRK
jgi:hypothetical protein